MKKSVLLILSLVLMLCVLAGCACEHEWRSATCEEPKTCRLCGETTGDALDHDWKDATCQEPKTCRECGKQKGEPAEHQWVEADCQQPKHCSVCNQMEGAVIDHNWEEATTEAPKTCTICQKTEGERIVTDERFTTAACQELFGTWAGEFTYDSEAMLGVTVEGEDLDFLVYVTVEFHNDGTLALCMEYDEESFFHALRLYTVELMYEEFIQEGYSRSEADQLMLDTYGQTIAEYVDEQIAATDIDDYTQELSGVYYVEDGVIYIANSWDEDMDSEAFALVDGILHYTEDEQTMELTKQ